VESGGRRRRRLVGNGSGRDESGAGATRSDLRRSKLKRIKISGLGREDDNGYTTAGDVRCKSNGKNRCDELRSRHHIKISK
jgi:hypothetical protein